MIGEALLAHQTAIRVAAFTLVLALMLGWQRLAPKRPAEARRRRWTANLGLVVIDALALRLLGPATGIGAALIAADRGWGLFNLLALPWWAAVPLALVLLDLAIYGQHVVSHRLPLLWRLHRVHHSDIAFDATTAVRFHPVEILLSMLYKAAVVILLGAPAVAVLAFEVILNAAALFNHGNVRLPDAIDRRLRLAIVTPDMHRVHHSLHRQETDSNFGFCLSWWDRLFGTYRAAPRDGHAGMTIGLGAFRDDRAQRLHQLLLQPFRSAADR